MRTYRITMVITRDTAYLAHLADVISNVTSEVQQHETNNANSRIFNAVRRIYMTS